MRQSLNAMSYFVSKKVMILAMCFLFLTIGSNAFADCTQNFNSIGMVGLGGAGDVIYAGLTSSTNECGCTTVRFYESNSDTKKILSILLAAKLARKEVRVDILDAADCNTGIRAYLH